MAYTFFIDGVQLPIAPPALRIKIKNQNKTITLINEGEVNVLKTPGLSEITFDAVLPQTRYPYAVYPGGFKTADYFLNMFERLKTERDSNGRFKPFQFIISRVLPSGKSLFDTNIKVSLEQYEIHEDAKGGFDVVVTLTLKQYRDYGTKTVRIASAGASEAVTVAQAVRERPAETAPQETTYTVVAGDSLWNIAKKRLGNGARYTEIYELNKDKIKNPNLINVGQVLILP